MACRRGLAGIVVGVALAFGVQEVGAQSRATTADLAGIVHDQIGAVLPGATVTAVNTATNLERKTITGRDGRYTIPALPPGIYRVRVDLQGFAPQVREPVTLALGASLDLDFTLGLAAAEEEVTVLAESPVVDIQQTAVATVVSQHQIDSLPINGRNFISFSILTPAVSTDRTPQQGASATSGLTFAGQRARSNNVTVDGLDNNDSSVGSVRAVFSQEAVQEFQVLTNSYSAEFGKASGGVLNIVTKSGSNALSGNAFVFFRDESLNAKEHFEKFDPAGNRLDRAKAPYSQWQFGATLGGPIKRDRLFYFAAVERLDVDANNFVNIDDTTPVSFLGRPLGTTADILRRAGFEVETGNVPYAVETTSFLTKVDGQIGAGQSVTFRYNWADSLNENVEPWGGQIAKSRGAYLAAKDHMFAASHTWVASSRTVNELRFQVAFRDQDVIALDPSCDGTCDREDEGGPTLEIGAIGVGRQRFTPQPRENVRYQVLDNLSYYLGAHQLKFGFDFSYVDNSESALPLHFGGRYIFRPLPAIAGLLPVPITAIQAVALGLPAAYVQGYGISAVPYYASDLSVYAQDNWRVRDDLTVRLGLRYQSQYWPSSTRVVPGAQPYEWPTDDDNFAPRIAASWDPEGDGRSSVFGSYGIFYDNHINAIFGITDGISGTASNVRTLVGQLPSPLPIVAWNAPGRRLPEPATAYPSLVISIDPGLKTPYAHQASAGYEREIGKGFAVAATLVVARGYDQIGTIDYNPILVDLGPGRRSLDVAGQAGTSAPVLQYTSFGETWYRGLTLTANSRFNGRWQLLASYTVSKAEDTSTDFQSFFIPQDNGRGRDPEDPAGLPIGFEPRAEKGASLQDQRHRLVVSGVYVAPWDIQVSGIVTLASGRPYNVLAGVDLNGDGNGGATAPDRPRANPADPSSSIERNAGVLPNEYSVDLRVSRRFNIGPRARIEGLFEVFNLFNRVNYTDVDNIFGTGAYPSSPLPTFGQFTQAAPPLQVQLAAKLIF